MKTARPSHVLPIDLTGCSITKKEENKCSLKFRLKGKTNSGIDVTGYWLTFETVRNLYTISWFLRNKREIEDKGSWTNEKTVSYPLKLPAKISTCQVDSKKKKLSYGDDDLNRLNGPPEARASDTVVLLAIEERRFEGRGPIPIICEKVQLVDKAGKSSEPAAAKAATAKQLAKLADELEVLARQFALSVYFGSLAEAKALMSPSFIKAQGAAGVRKATGQYWGAAKRFKSWNVLTQLGPYKNAKNPWKPTVAESWYRDFLQNTMGVELTTGKLLQSKLANYPLPDYISSLTQVRGLATICSPLFERSDFDFAFAIVDQTDNGTLRIDAITTFE